MTEGLKPETIEKPKLEWGPDLGRMSWHDAQTKIDRLNECLAEGEKPWRLPTKGELVAEFKKTNSTPDGFEKEYYWADVKEPAYYGVAFMVGMGYGNENDHVMDYPYGHVRLVRDAA